MDERIVEHNKNEHRNNQDLDSCNYTITCNLLFYQRIVVVVMVYSKTFNKVIKKKIIKHIKLSIYFLQLHQFFETQNINYKLNISTQTTTIKFNS